MIGYGEGVARGFALVGRLNGYPLGGARAGHFIIDFSAETHRAGGGIQCDRAGVAGGLGNGVCYARGKGGCAQPGGDGEGLGGAAVGAEEHLGFADRGIIEGEPHCRRINGCRGIDRYRRIDCCRRIAGYRRGRGFAGGEDDGGAEGAGGRSSREYL